MRASIVLITFVSFLPSQLCAQDVEDVTLKILDSMVDMMLGSGQFSREYYEELRFCMQSMDVQFPKVSDNSWQGLIDYWNNGGGVDDLWGENGSNYMEHNITVTNIDNMTIYEPCGYTSNVAYYHPATEICARYNSTRGFDLPLDFIQSFVRGFCNLAMGSSFMHGSNTELGHVQDVTTLALLAYQIHQASLAVIPRSAILHDLSYTLRERTAFELIVDQSDMFLNSPVEEWYDYTKSLDIPDYYLVYAATFTTVADIALEPEIVDVWIPALAELFGVDAEDIDFLTSSYLPELRNYTLNVELGEIARARFLANSLGTLAKFMYAFLWQEETITLNGTLLTEEANALGWELLPTFNSFIGQFQTFPYFDDDFQIGQDIYPGDFNCNPVIPHAKWHLQAAIGMLDLAYLGEEVYSILSKASDTLK